MLIIDNSSISLNLYRTIRHVHYKIQKELRNELTEKGVTWPQFHTLFHIKDEGIPFNKLAQKVHCNASNMTGLIDRMEDNGWVYRERSEKDRRVWLVKLTAEGSEMRENLIPKHRNNIEERMNRLTQEEQKTLKKLMEKLMEDKE